MAHPAHVERARVCATGHVAEIWRNKDHSYTLFSYGFVNNNFMYDFAEDGCSPKEPVNATSMGLEIHWFVLGVADHVYLTTQPCNFEEALVLFAAFSKRYTFTGGIVYTPDHVSAFKEFI